MVVTNAAVVKPRSADELANSLREAAAAGKAVTPVGGGRAATMGGPLERCDVEIRTTALDRVVEHTAADMVVTVEAGIQLEALQEHLAKSGQFLPLDPFNSPGHTVGGLLAGGWSGPLRLRYGSARDFMIGIRVALPVAIVVTLLVEILTSIEGIGALMIGAQRNFQSPQVYGLLVLIGLFGLLVNSIFAVFEAILLRRWPPKTQSENF